MMLYINVFVFLVLCHSLCDFALQNDYIAKAKNRNDSLGKNGIWVIVLSAHAMIHTLPVFLLGSYLFGIDSSLPLVLSLIMVTTHWLIDFFKCENKITYYQDQILHIFIVIILTAIIWGLNAIN